MSHGPRGMWRELRNDKIKHFETCTCQQLRLVKKQTTDRLSLPEANRWQCRVAVQIAFLLKNSSAHTLRNNNRQMQTARWHGNTCSYVWPLAVHKSNNSAVYGRIKATPERHHVNHTASLVSRNGNTVLCPNNVSPSCALIPVHKRKFRDRAMTNTRYTCSEANSTTTINIILVCV